LVERQWRADLLDPAGAQDDDLVGHGHRLDLIVGDVDHRRTEAAVQFGQFAAHVDAEFGVEVGERFTEQEDAGLAHDRAADRDALALTAGEGGRAAVEVVLTAEHAGCFGDAGGDLAP
jgi:hypothetical protein